MKISRMQQTAELEMCVSQNSSAADQDLASGGAQSGARGRIEAARLSRRHLGSFLLMLGDCCAVAAMFAAAFFASRLLPSDPPRLLSTDPLGAAFSLRSLLVFAMLSAGLIGVLRYCGHYRRWMPPVIAIRQVFVASAYGAFVCAMLVIVTDASAATRWLLMLWALVPLAIVAARAVVVPLLCRNGLWRQRSLIVCTPRGFEKVSEIFRSDGSNGYEIVASLDFDVFLARASGNGEASGERETESRLRRLLDDFGAEFLLLAFHGCKPETQQMALAVVGHEQIPFAVMPDFEGLPVFGCESHYFMAQSLTMLTYNNNLAHPMRRFMKAAFDRCVGGVAILFLLPVLAIIALAVKVDGGPVLFSHERVGKGGKFFGCLKFRTMVVNSEQALQSLLARDPHAAAEWSLTRKLRKDPRITGVGRILRTTSLDELPQLFNVLIGQMSLVGPRPIVRAEVPRYGRSIEFYYRTRPGMTGLWQVSGRSGTSYDRRVQMDVWYVKNWSLLHDIVILFKTMPALLTRAGAA